MFDPNPRGSLFVYDYVNQGELQEIRLIGCPPSSDFHPLGIKFYREQIRGLTRLFVVNHQRNESTVDVFDLDYATNIASFILSVGNNDGHIVSPNAVAPTSYTSFYVSNDHRFTARCNPVLNHEETTRALPLGWITHVDFSKIPPVFSTAASWIPFANGMLVTPTGKEVVVASSSSCELFVYNRDPKTNSLTIRTKVPLTFAPDNLSFDESLSTSDPTVFDQKQGYFLRGLTCAGHPSIPKLIAMSRNPRKFTAASWAVEIFRNEAEGVDKSHDETPVPALSEKVYQGPYAVRTVYQSDGTHFPSSTTCAMDSSRGITLIGGLYARGLLRIKMGSRDI